jgi:hypothetical protein
VQPGRLGGGAGPDAPEKAESEKDGRQMPLPEGFILIRVLGGAA